MLILLQLLLIGYLVVHHCASKVVGYCNLAFLATGTEQAIGFFPCCLKIQVLSSCTDVGMLQTLARSFKLQLQLDMDDMDVGHFKPTMAKIRLKSSF